MSSRPHSPSSTYRIGLGGILYTFTEQSRTNRTYPDDRLNIPNSSDTNHENLVLPEGGESASSIKNLEIRQSVISPIPKNPRHSRDFPPTEATDTVVLSHNSPIEFHIEFRFIVSKSPVLASMINFPVEADSNTMVNTRPTEMVLSTCTLPENVSTVDAILRFCHPKIRNPKVQSLEQLFLLLKACKKYQLAYGLQNLGVTLVQFAAMTASGRMPGTPLTCYALACQFGLYKVANLVSTHCLSVDFLTVDLAHELSGASVENMQRLFHFHRRRGLQAMAIIDNGVGAYEMWCNGCKGVACWYEFFREVALFSLKSKPVSTHIFSPSVLAGCLKQAAAKCPYCVNHYLASRTQLRLAVMQKEVDELRDQL